MLLLSYVMPVHKITGSFISCNETGQRKYDGISTSDILLTILFGKYTPSYQPNFIWGLSVFSYAMAYSTFSYTSSLENIVDI